MGREVGAGHVQSCPTPPLPPFFPLAFLSKAIFGDCNYNYVVCCSQIAPCSLEKSEVSRKNKVVFR